MLAMHQPRPQPSRLYFLDHLKVFLTVLVIVHHIGQPYGPTGGFWYFEDSLSFWPLGPFFRVNASFFMGLFFLVSGYFMPGAVDRKGPGAFLKDRLKRLGLPLLALFLTVIPVLMYTHYVQIRGGALPFWGYIREIYLGLAPRPEGLVSPSWPELQFGHLWFVEHLLFYAVCYAVGRVLVKRRASTEAGAAPGTGAVLLFIAALTVVTYFVRGPYPIDKWVGFLGFIQLEPAHLPQYLSFLIIGAAAYRKGWFRSFPSAAGMGWLAIGLLLSLAPVTVQWASLGRYWPRWVDVLWECSFAVSISIGLLTLFRDRFNGAHRLLEWLGANAFAAYLIHVPVIVAIQYAFGNIAAGALVKFLLVSLLGVPATFGISHLLRQIPFVGKLI